MIGFLRGEIVVREDPYIIVNVNGVGYKVFASSPLLSKIEGEEGTVKIFTYTHVREDNISLFGFAESSDLKLFEKLISVSGIGPKTAMGIFSVGTREMIIDAIVRGDAGFFTQVPRLGTKNSQKIIIELKNKFGGEGELDLLGHDSKNNKEVISALEGFGFSKKEAIGAIKEIKADGKKVEDRIRMALKYLGK